MVEIFTVDDTGDVSVDEETQRYRWCGRAQHVLSIALARSVEG